MSQQLLQAITDHDVVAVMRCFPGLSASDIEKRLYDLRNDLDSVLESVHVRARKEAKQRVEPGKVLLNGQTV